MIDLGKDLPLIEQQYKTDKNIIKGCQSKVWVHAELEGEKLQFTADSDAIITKGIIAILIRSFSGQHPAANGLVSMIKQLKMYAVAYQTQLN